MSLNRSIEIFSDYRKNKPLIWGGLSLFLLILTWPHHEADTMTGLDGSYFSLLNWFAAYDLSKLQYLGFTYGPLGFLRNTLALGDNLTWGLWFQSLLKFSLLFLLFKKESENQSMQVLFLFGYIFSVFFPFDFLFYGLIVLFISSYEEKNLKAYLILIGFLSSIGFLIKINIGINISLILIGWLSWRFVKEKTFLELFWIGGMGILFYGFLWLLIFQDLGGSIDLLTGYVGYILQNPDGTSTFPPNSWLALSLCLSFLVAFAYLERDNSRLRSFLVALPFFLFAEFKYSFNRQSGNHSGELLLVLVFIAFFYFLWTKIPRLKSMLAIIACIAFYSINLHINGTFPRSKYSRSWIGINNFYEQVVHHSDYKKEWEKKGKKNLGENVIPNNWRSLIGDSYVDAFPWDASYMIANKLNYRPRLGIFTAGTPPGMVLKNKEVLLSKEGPEYIIWEKRKYTGQVGGLDRQYLFNMDGEYTRAILGGFKVIRERGRDALLKRNSGGYSEKKVRTEDHSWGDEILVPESDSSFAWFITLESDLRFFSKMKASLYKIPRAKIIYRLETGETKEYEITRGSMKSGIWVSPYLNRINTELEGIKVNSISFIQPKENIIFNTGIKITWHQFRPEAR